MPNWFHEKQKLVELTRIPRSNRTLQAPAHARIGDDLYLSYYVESHDPNWTGELSKNPAQALEACPHVVVHFPNTVFFSSQMVEDDILSSHPMAPLGLKSFRQYEVAHSQKVADLSAAYGKSEIKQHIYPNDLRHFVFAMHGYVFEIVSGGFDLHKETGSVLSSIEKIVRTQSGHSD